MTTLLKVESNRRCRLRLLLLAALITGLSPVTGLTADPVQPSRAGAADRATFVILAPGGPVLADLRISVAGRPCRRWTSEFLARQLDTDRSGTLDEQELELLTDRIRGLVGVQTIRGLLQDISGNAAAGSVTSDAFTEWLHAHLPQVFSIIALPKAPADAVRLTALIDLNQDSAVSADELSVAVRTLRFRDLDDDETFSLSELLPFRDPRSENAAITPGVAGLPFIEITDAAAAEACAAVLLKRRGRDGVLSTAELRLSEQQRRSAGIVDASVLDQPSLARLLQQPVFHLTIDVRLSDKANRSDVLIQVADSAVEFCRASKPAFGRAQVVLDGMPLAITARGGSANNRAFGRGFLGQSFAMSDSDRNQYLDAQEFTGMAAALSQADVVADFSMIDGNSDGMLTRDEIFRFADRDFIATASRIEVTVEQDGRTLFSLLDYNADRRLSRRELLDGATRLQTYDRGQDGQWTDSELGTEYQLVIGLGRSEARRASATAGGLMELPTGQQTDAILPDNSAVPGPEWFRRMDRNRDGDVSRREFPGTAAGFSEIDINADGLISPSEAESAAGLSDPRS